MSRKAILLNDTSNENHLGCGLVIQNIKKLCRENKVTLLDTFERKNIHPANPRLLSNIELCDFIIVNGEGSLHHSSEATSGLIEFGDKPKVLINAVWDKMFLVGDSLNNFSYISVRENRSCSEIIKSVSKARVHIVPDMIFYATGSVIIHKIGYGDSVMDFVREKFKKERNYFPMQVTASYPDIYAYVNWLKSLDLYVTGRFHGVCLAMMFQVPFLAVPSNSHKIEGLLEDCGCSDLLIRDKKEVLLKKKRAKELVPQAYSYAASAKQKIEESFKAAIHSIGVSKRGVKNG